MQMMQEQHTRGTQRAPGPGSRWWILVSSKEIFSRQLAGHAAGLPVLKMTFLFGGRFLLRDLFFPPHRQRFIGHTQYSIQTVPTKARRRSAEMTPVESKVSRGEPRPNRAGGGRLCAHRLVNSNNVLSSASTVLFGTGQTPPPSPVLTIHFELGNTAPADPESAGKTSSLAQPPLQARFRAGSCSSFFPISFIARLTRPF